MKIHRHWLAGLSAIGLAALAIPAHAIDKAPGYSITLRAGPSVGAPSLVAAEPMKGKAVTARFVVKYTGFTPAARAAFQRAVNIWATKIVSAQPITVEASFQALDPGVLGSAGPTSIYGNFPGATVRNVWYPVAIANKRANRQLNGADAEIVARFSSVFPNWHYGTGPAPANKYDFTTVVLHELGHGLGFIGTGTPLSGGRGTVKPIQGFPTIYDTFVENLQGQRLVSLPNNSVAIGRALVSNNLFFQITPTQRVKLYAPSSFQQGSSYSHFDEATFRKGNPNSLMTPQLGQGETIRNPGPLTLQLFKDSGW